MTGQEAKNILLKYEELINKTNRLFKKGAQANSLPFIKLHRKRIEMLNIEQETESIVRDADPDFYRAWTERIIDKPTGWNFLQYQADIKAMANALNNAMQAKNEGRIVSPTIDSAEVMKYIYRDLDNPEWRAAIARSSYLTAEQQNALLHRSDIMQEFCRTYEQWADTMRHVSTDIVDVDEYVRNAYRILWVLPYDLPLQQGSIHAMLRAYANWNEFHPQIFAYCKIFYASFIIQQLYFYRYDKDELLSYSNLNRHTSIEDWYHSLRQTAIGSLAHTSPEELRDLICTLQPNFILSPGCLPQVFSAIGRNMEQDEIHLLTGKIINEGTATLHLTDDIAFIQTSELIDPSVSTEEYVTDICTLARFATTDYKSHTPLPAEINREIDPACYLHKEIKEAIARHCYIDMLYPDGEDMKYVPVRLLPCLLKKHAGEWYVIGKRPGSAPEPFHLSAMQNFSFTEQTEEVSESLLLPYRYAPGVHLRTDLRLNPQLATDGPQLFIIRLRVQSPLWKEFRLHPLHFSQELMPRSSADGTCRCFQYKTYITDEFIRLIRGYGKQVEVLSPKVLAEELCCE